MGRIDRRKFLKASAALGAAGLGSGALGGVDAQSADLVGPSRTGDDAKFCINYFRSFKAPDPATWEMVVDGLVENPTPITVRDLEGFAYHEQTTRLKCVECWSAKATWGGFRYDDLAALVRPKPEARYAFFRCANGYFDGHPIETLRFPKVLFVWKMLGQPLEPKHGAPLRLILPHKYGYKSTKSLIRMTFMDHEEKGYWSVVGPYSQDGTILPGYDHPLDLGQRATPINGGEVTDY